MLAHRHHDENPYRECYERQQRIQVHTAEEWEREEAYDTHHDGPPFSLMHKTCCRHNGRENILTFAAMRYYAYIFFTLMMLSLGALLPIRMRHIIFGHATR